MQEKFDIVEIKDKESVEQFCEYLKSFIEEGSCIDLSETFNEAKLGNAENGFQQIGLGTMIKDENKALHLVLSFKKVDKKDFIDGLKQSIDL